MSQRKVALVTGGSRGIGAAIARRLAADGVVVVVNYVERRDEADAVVDDIARSGGEAVAVQADISKPDGVSGLFDAASARFGGLDVLVNNASFVKLAPFQEMSDADYEAQISINVGAVFRGMREGARRLRDGGRIISLSTSVVGTCLPSYGVYAATKAAVETMTRTLAKELACRDITVNAVAPGPVGTEGFYAGKSDAAVKAISEMGPFKRLGRPEEIAAVVSFLAGVDGGWVSGQTIRANGAFV